MVVLVALGCVHANSSRAADSAACDGVSKSTVVVEARAHELYLCEGGRAATHYSVRLGKRGVGKTREGDGKTPLGAYPLGPPVPSASFGLFIPVGYPTAAQRRQGYTGSAIGIHGPKRGVRWLGGAVNWFDTTDGCIGIAGDDEMDRIARWLKAHPAAGVEIR